MTSRAIVLRTQVKNWAWQHTLWFQCWRGSLLSNQPRQTAQLQVQRETLSPKSKVESSWRRRQPWPLTCILKVTRLPPFACAQTHLYMQTQIKQNLYVHRLFSLENFTVTAINYSDLLSFIPTELVVQIVAWAQNVTCSEAYVLLCEGRSHKRDDWLIPRHSCRQLFTEEICNPEESKEIHYHTRSLYCSELIVNSRKNEGDHRKQTEKLSSFWAI